jgi:hypothetical protein
MGSPQRKPQRHPGLQGQRLIAKAASRPRRPLKGPAEASRHPDRRAVADGQEQRHLEPDCHPHKARHSSLAHYPRRAFGPSAT